MMDEHGWRLNSKCSTLSPQEADDLFFPGTGGKPHKARKYCNQCPFKGKCLQDAIENNLKGFFAGTTDEQRRDMAFIHHMTVSGLPMPPEPDRTKRAIYLKVFSPEDPRNWLDADNLEPDEAELAALEKSVA